MIFALPPTGRKMLPKPRPQQPRSRLSQVRPKRPQAPKPDLTMPTAPAPTAAYTIGKPKPDLPPPAGIVILLSRLLSFIDQRKGIGIETIFFFCFDKLNLLNVIFKSEFI